MKPEQLNPEITTETLVEQNIEQPSAAPKSPYAEPTGWRMPLRWRVFSYMMIFASIMLIILSLVQTLWLDVTYRYVRINQVDTAASALESYLVDGQVEEAQQLAINLAQKYEACITVMDTTGRELVRADILSDCLIHHMAASEYSRFYQLAISKGGQTTETYDMGAFGSAVQGNKMQKLQSYNQTALVYAAIVPTAGQPLLLLINVNIIPMVSTVSALNVQLVFLSVLMLGVALLMSLALSQHLAQPLVNMTRRATKLAEGNFEPTFEGGGSQEITVLADTLNTAAIELGKHQKLQEELVANISHDLRTPMTMIRGYAEVMRDLPGENTPENAQLIAEEATRLSTMVDELLDKSLLQSGVQQLSYERFDLTQLLNQLDDSYSRLRGIDGYDIIVENCDETVYVFADRYRIEQVLRNLINNGLAHAGEDKLVFLKQTIKEDVVRVDVRDNGRGIAPEDLPYIWERYYRSRKASRRRFSGSGVGLSIVSSVLKLHGVNYGVESEVGKGTTFWFELQIDK
ncbi:MAG: HAMP domain-containing histidine kinase [Firmicutes bacterium]|nr:HAMP domain-containing histidine kinase [Bacillota bacterium]